MRIAYIVTLLSLLFLVSCKPNKETRDLDEILTSGELRIITLNTSTSYFIYREDTLGFDFEMARNFCDSLGVKLKVIIAENEQKMTELLMNREGDLIAYPIKVDVIKKDSFNFCGPESITHQVLIQRANKGDTILKNQIDLIGKSVYTIRDSKYNERLRNFNEELGGGINIQYVDRDTLTAEDLIEMVSSGEIRYTVADEYLAKLNKTYYNNINISLPMSFEQRMSWAVRKESSKLAEALNSWKSKYGKTPNFRATNKRYFELSKRPLIDDFELPKGLPKGAISPYDDLFKKHAEGTNYDWALLAAMSYHESRFLNNRKSWAGAAGIMGLMPRTAKSLGLKEDERMNPDLSISAAVKLLDRLDVIFNSVADTKERLKFILAAYNGGDGHIRDAQNLANKYGANKSVWDNNVRKFVLLKRNPTYFNDPVCKNGYFRGSETVKYVDNVLETAERFRNGI